jgi:hypothetical protein
VEDVESFTKQSTRMKIIFENIFCAPIAFVLPVLEFVLDFFSLLEKNGEQTFHPTRAHDYQNSLNKIPKLYGTCHILASLLGTDLQMSRSPFLKHYITPF